MITRLMISLLVCFAAAGLRAAEVELVRVWPSWRDAASFERISEYFGGREKHAGETILRTHATERAGYYFLVRVKNAAPRDGAKFQVSVIRPDAPEAKTYTFPASVPAKETVFHLGITGGDWPGGREANPVAWKITLTGADGRVLAEHKSFLWEKPAK